MPLVHLPPLPRRRPWARAGAPPPLTGRPLPPGPPPLQPPCPPPPGLGVGTWDRLGAGGGMRCAARQCTEGVDGAYSPPATQPPRRPSHPGRLGKGQPRGAEPPAGAPRGLLESRSHLPLPREARRSRRSAATPPAPQGSTPRRAEGSGRSPP
eukprot:11139967-Alexandrium_andersonii.AAC.1